ASRRAQRHVQDRTLLGDVDLVTTKHRSNPLLKAAFFGQLKEKLQRFVCDAILRVVEVYTGSFCRHAIAALRVTREKLAKVQLPDLFTVGFESLPRLPFDGAASGERFEARCHVLAPFVFCALHESEHWGAFPRGEILREMRWRCRPSGSPGAAISV